ncbi:DUF1672 family protein [Metabacillus sp. 84]
MRITYSLLSIELSLILLTGCSFIKVFEEGSQGDDLYASVQEYTGEGFYLPNSSKEITEIANKHKEEITKAVEDFFISNYKTPVTVHNLVGAQDGVSVFVESKGEPHFYTLAIVPVYITEEKVHLKEVRSLEGKIEEAIATGLYGMINKDQFKELNRYLSEVQGSYPVTGKRIEAIQKTSPNGFGKSEYYTTSLDETLDELAIQYIQDPIKTKELIEKGNIPKVDPEKFIITIQLFMEDKSAAPNQEILDSIVSGIKNNSKLPRGVYSIILNDNRISKRTGVGEKNNSLITTEDSIILR